MIDHRFRSARTAKAHYPPHTYEQDYQQEYDPYTAGYYVPQYGYRYPLQYYQGLSLRGLGYPGEPGGYGGKSRRETHEPEPNCDPDTGTESDNVTNDDDQGYYDAYIERKILLSRTLRRILSRRLMRENVVIPCLESSIRNTEKLKGRENNPSKQASLEAAITCLNFTLEIMEDEQDKADRQLDALLYPGDPVKEYNYNEGTESLVNELFHKERRDAPRHESKARSKRSGVHGRGTHAAQSFRKSTMWGTSPNPVFRRDPRHGSTGPGSSNVPHCRDI